MKTQTDMTIRSDGCVEQINCEWFVCVDSSSIDEPITYHGGEIVNGGVYGPFALEAEAYCWLQGYDLHSDKAMRDGSE